MSKYIGVLPLDRRPYKTVTAEPDLIERLRDFEGSDELGNGDFSLLSEAAAALEAAELREAQMHDAMRQATERLAEVARECEGLRAEVKDYRENGAFAVRFAPNSAYWSAELRRLFGDDARGGIEVLEQWHSDSLARAERLAEALRHQRWCRTCAEDGWESCEDGRKADALLNPAAAQENDDA